MSYLYGLGADPFVITADAVSSVFDHSLIKYRAKPVYLRLVNTLVKANDYAAGGFHVAVTRGLAGGCSDLSTAFNGTGPSSCAYPLNRSDLKSKWKLAAQAYHDAYWKKNLADMLSGLIKANGLANAAFAAEGIDPPRDPISGQKEPPATLPGKPGDKPGILDGGFGEAGLPLLAVAGLGAWYFWGGGKGSKKKGKRKGGKRKARKGGRRKVRRARRGRR